MGINCVHWVATGIWLSVNTSSSTSQEITSVWKSGLLEVFSLVLWTSEVVFPFCSIHLLGDESTASFAVLMQGVHPNKMQRDMCCLSLWWWLLISNTCLQYFPVKGFHWPLRSHEWFWGLKRWQMDATKCMLCCNVVRKEQITCLVVETSSPKNVVVLGGPRLYYCTALCEWETQTGLAQRFSRCVLWLCSCCRLTEANAEK